MPDNPGRPQLAPHRKRHIKLVIRVNPSELEEISANAARAQKDRAAYMRERALYARFRRPDAAQSLIRLAADLQSEIRAIADDAEARAYADEHIDIAAISADLERYHRIIDALHAIAEDL